MIDWNKIPPITCTYLIYANPLTCSVCTLERHTWTGATDRFDFFILGYWQQTDLHSGRSSIWQRRHIGASGWKEDQQPSIHSWGNIKGDCFCRELNFCLENLGSPYGRRKRAWLVITILNRNTAAFLVSVLHPMHACICGYLEMWTDTDSHR